MTFQIDSIRFGSNLYGLPEMLNGSTSNRITVLVGPNGVGKSRILAAMSHHFTGRRSKDEKKWDYPTFKVSRNSLEHPTKVITQTFSPFSRFPRERTKPIDLLEYLSPTYDRYSTIGFTRNMGIRGSVSKDTVGRIVRKLLTSPNHAKPLEVAMVSLGFTPKITLGYARSPIGSFIDFEESSKNLLIKSIGEFLDLIINKSKNLPEELRLVREIESQPKNELSLRIFNSIKQLQQLASESNALNIKSKHKTYILDLHLSNVEDKTLSYLEAIVTLTRLGLLRLVESQIQQSAFADSLYNDSRQIDLVDASSGEQQLLSSLFGIVAEAENNSLILIDEPELSLHPEWQTKVIDLITYVVNAFSGCHVFIASHSALVAQRSRELGLDVLSLGKQEGFEVSDNKNVSVEQTLLELFRLPVRDSTYVARLILSLVIKAENYPSESENVIQQLKLLESTYKNAHNIDENTLSLIKDALEIVSLN